ncbi:unnamed protein product, partial [Laminaria digitata]
MRVWIAWVVSVSSPQGGRGVGSVTGLHAGARVREKYSTRYQGSFIVGMNGASLSHRDKNYGQHIWSFVFKVVIVLQRVPRGESTERNTVQWGTRFKNRSEQASFAALIAVPLLPQIGGRIGFSKGVIGVSVGVIRRDK